MSNAEVTVYGSGAAEFSVGDLRVLVRGISGSEGAETLAGELADAASALAAKDLLIEAHRKALTYAEEAVLRLQGDLAVAHEVAKEARGQARPAKLHGTGYVRFDPQTHKPWLLGHREKGWSAFGFQLESWDELFRRFNVAVVDHGTDETGPYWTVTNIS